MNEECSRTSIFAIAIRTQSAPYRDIQKAIYNASTRTRTNTNPNDTEANAAGRSVRACVARKSNSKIGSV